MGKQFSVLVIDDAEDIRDMFLCHPSLSGFDVAVAEDGRTGLDLAQQIVPDVILLDWNMPEMDGMEVLAELKKDPGTKNIPVFMLTAKKAPADVGWAICERADGYFAKPFDIASLSQILRQKLTSLVRD
jgi:two-component system phosphate regulon response regulator PhoB/two-component system alkaline phosphatase synthesis response regulator PhoP